ncbi:aminotransferase class I/II-fold pyridoxal phosphate-dependent enzyme [Robertmurraya yapensis]|uniref:Aminotransferase class I/II-fold pyridoxal phosphate-dependent enzyme n=1 Tax=Bacillus yapensis TaxID=2492960 RepID=A0A431W3I3_9BACI|nr:aminotransferase class I/II-fold pyridoxal phosphate-dependent enzyme [Bacillus yapensis]RTR30011.1 aminotransferase class I/II-fold pyridoxal phosphate-dependent enzyme [Bacillus yapensis]TKS95092.1 aminotransferase class I/II-fold pyridoxal phosphate-dependent enzyme [Bacillus yapensis]
MSKEAKIYLSPPHMSGNEQKYITEAFESNWIAPLGPNVDAFEEEIAKYVGVKGAVAVSSGTAAIHLALSLLGIKKGDRVFCSTLTFVASANPILYQDATPVFIDSEPDTWNMSPQALRRALEVSAIDGKLPKAVVVVNLYGQSAKMHEIASICHDYNVPIIEDAAESLGSTYKGKYSGTFGKFGIYSFNGNKIITTSGGGMLVSDDVEALIRARFLATQARDQARYYQHSELGFNYRLSNILAGIGRAQFEVLEERVEVRRAIFDYYYKELMNLPGFQFMEELQDTRSNRWLTALTVNQHESGTTVNFLLDLLEKENIEARPVWKPLHMQPLFRDCEYYPHSSDENVSEYLFENGICLPSGSSLKEIDQKRVIQCIKQAIGTNSDAQHRSDTQILLS